MNIPKHNIFVSTGAFQEKSLAGILGCRTTDGCHCIELSSGVEYGARDQMLLKKALDSGSYQFLIHNYFPVPEDPFVLNLASNDQGVLAGSREHCKAAIRLTAELGAPFYSVHCGFCFHAGPEHLGMDQTKLERFPREVAYNIFVESLELLADYATQYGVGLLIENNILAPFNLIDGCNELLLGVTSGDLATILQTVSSDNCGLLLDVGHLRVSANTLGFSPELFLQELGPAVQAIHLSENDGLCDSNQEVSEDSWFWDPLGKTVTQEIVWVLEAYNLSLSSIRSQLALIEKKLYELAGS